MAEETKRPRCAWCGHEILEDSINIPVQSKIDNVFICYECAKKIYLNKELREKRQLFRKLRLRGGSVKKKMTPSALKEYLDGYIIGQDKAKEVLSVAIYNHYKMLRLKKDLEGDEAELDKSNIFIVGPSGCGKTAMLKRVAQVLHVPFAMIDATSITASGWTTCPLRSTVALKI